MTKLKILLLVIAAFPVSVPVRANSAEFSVYAKPIPNFRQVTEQLFRGGRPSNANLAELKQRGIGTVINLENEPGPVANERRAAEQLGLNFVSSPMSWLTRPEDQQVDNLLSLLADESAFPIFLHCRHGEDRTGLIMGLYRVLVQGWRPADAYKEMLALGFHPSFKALDDYFRERTGMN